MRSSTLIAVLSALLTAQASPLDSRNEKKEERHERTLPVTRDGTQLKLAGKPWTASGANVYWLGLVGYLHFPIRVIERLCSLT